MSDRPLPADPYVRALALADVSIRAWEKLEAACIAKAAIVEAQQAELRAMVVELDYLTTTIEEIGRVIVVERERTPWRNM